jgi:hypothetical protein
MLLPPLPFCPLQPVTVIQDVTGELQVSASDSYAFVEDLFDELVDYRLPLSTFLQIKKSYFSYLAVGSDAPIKLSWNLFPPSNVTDWSFTLSRSSISLLSDKLR